MRHLHLVAIGLVVAVLITACVDDSRPADCGVPDVVREATLADGRLEPNSINVCRGQDVTLHLTADEPGVLHIHGYDAELPAVQLQLGENEIGFVASRAGQFPVELHTQEDPAGAELAIFTVHEP